MLRKVAAVIPLIPIILLVVTALHASDRTSRSLITVRFKQIDPQGYPVVRITNRTGKDIDDVRGGFVMEEPNGRVLYAAGHTEAVPGAMFLAAGETKEWIPYGLHRKPRLMDRLRRRPATVRFFFVTRSMTYMDGTEAKLAR